MESFMLVNNIYHTCITFAGMSSGIWAPFKELASVVNEAILQKQPDAFYRLEAILKKHKPDFISLLKNPVCILGDWFLPS